MNSRKHLTRELVVSVLGSIFATALFISAGLIVDWFFSLNIPLVYLIPSVLALSAVVSLFVLARAYGRFLQRVERLSFLREDSASKSFELFIELTRQFLAGTGRSKQRTSFEQDVLPQVHDLIDRRRQPMQIILVDSERIRTEAQKHGYHVSVEDQLRYYLDFMSAYKRMAMPRVIRQASMYIEAFGNDGITDYVLMYGHSTVAVESVISGYRIAKFPIRVVAD